MSGTRLALREHAKAASKQLFLAGERIGVHALPVHYYSPVPSRRWLRSHEAL